MEVLIDPEVYDEQLHRLCLDTEGDDELDAVVEAMLLRSWGHDIDIKATRRVHREVEASIASGIFGNK